MDGDLRMNERAARIAAAMAADAAALRIRLLKLDNGARVIDAGVEVEGGLSAGQGLAEACMGGLGRVAFTELEIGELRLPGLLVSTDHPAESCMAAQYAGWKIDPEGYFAMGSGPIRAAARVEKELYEKLGYGENPASGVLILEGRQLPGVEVAEYVARRSNLAADRLTILIAPTASLAGGVQIAARVVETTLHKMLELGFDIRQVLSGIGTAPLPPVAKNDLRAIGRTNDCVLYGGRVHLTVRSEDDELEELVPRIPSSTSEDHGTPFYEIFQRYEGDFYKIDPDLFSPAEVCVTNVESGRSFRAGQLEPAVLERSLFA